MTTLHGDEDERSMDAHRLKVLYERQLAEDLRPPVAESVDRRGTRAMLRASEPMPGGKLCEEDRAGVWLWSDLHLLMPCRSPSSVDPSRLLRRWPTRSSSVGASRSSPRPWSSSISTSSPPRWPVFLAALAEPRRRAPSVQPGGGGTTAPGPAVSALEVDRGAGAADERSSSEGRCGVNPRRAPRRPSMAP